MKTLLILFMFTLLLIPLRATRVSKLPELLKPIRMAVNSNRLYVVDGTEIHIYSLNPCKHIKKFGKKGEGPKEFPSAPIISLTDEHIFFEVIFKKVMLFTLDGEFVREKRIPNFTFIFTPFGDNYLARTMTTDRDTRKQTTQINLYDQDFKFLKTLDQQIKKSTLAPGNKIKMEAVDDYFGFRVSGDKIFIGDSSKGFYLKVLNAQGKQLYEIERDYEKRPVTSQYKKFFMAEMKKSPRWGQMKNVFDVTFANHFPAYDNFYVVGEKIHFTHHREDEDTVRETILDLKGHFIKNLLVTRPDEGVRTRYKNKFYFIKENEDEETWELHVQNILE